MKTLKIGKVYMSPENQRKAFAPIEPQCTARLIHEWAREHKVFLTEGLAEDLARKVLAHVNRSNSALIEEMAAAIKYVFASGEPLLTRQAIKKFENVLEEIGAK